MLQHQLLDLEMSFYHPRIFFAYIVDFVNHLSLEPSPEDFGKLLESMNNDEED